ncbi:MAG: hypothetical protein ACTS2F_02250 [Thainema sp.]
MRPLQDHRQKIWQKVSWHRSISPQGIRYIEDSLLDDSALNRDYLVLISGLLRDRNLWPVIQ